MENARTTNSRIAVNPWNNKVKSRGEGLLNGIMNKYFSDEDNQDISQIQLISQQERQYLQIAQQIKDKYQINNSIDENLSELFQLKKKCSKIDEILTWIEKIQEMGQPQQAEDNTNSDQLQKNASQTAPIDSSFIYLPGYCGTTLHEILKDCCQIKENRRSIGVNRNKKLVEVLDEIKSVQNLNKLLQNNIL